jgi:hypothetical protein
MTALGRKRTFADVRYRPEADTTNRLRAVRLSEESGLSPFA